MRASHNRPTPARDLFLQGQLRVGRCRRVDSETAGIADICHVVKKFEIVDEGAARLLAAPEFEATSPPYPPFRYLSARSRLIPSCRDRCEEREGLKDTLPIRLRQFVSVQCLPARSAAQALIGETDVRLAHSICLELTANEFLEGPRFSPEKPGQNVGVSDKIVI